MSNSEITLEMLPERRRKNGYTQQRAAEALGFHRNTVSTLETTGVFPAMKPWQTVVAQFIYGLSVEQFAVIEATAQAQPKSARSPQAASAS